MHDLSYSAPEVVADESWFLTDYFALGVIIILVNVPKETIFGRTIGLDNLARQVQIRAMEVPDGW